jgi:ketosteroid isomerase-like protein
VVDGGGIEAEDGRRRLVLAFNEAINERDLETLRGLMTEDHAFIDSDGNAVSGKRDVTAAWEGFFASFPDYRNSWEQLISRGEVIIAIGHSDCASEPQLDGPAIWTAKSRGSQICEWRVYEDTSANRARLGIGAG